MEEKYWLVTEPARGEQRKLPILEGDDDGEQSLRRAYPNEAAEYDEFLADNPDDDISLKNWIESDTCEQILLVDLWPSSPTPRGF